MIRHHPHTRIPGIAAVAALYAQLPPAAVMRRRLTYDHPFDRSPAYRADQRLAAALARNQRTATASPTSAPAPPPNPAPPRHNDSQEAQAREIFGRR